MSARFHYFADRFGSGLMACYPRQLSLFRPPTVTIHDDSHVPGKTGKVELLNQQIFLAAWFNEIFKVFGHRKIIGACI
jgi:hypothetical protein